MDDFVLSSDGKSCLAKTCEEIEFLELYHQDDIEHNIVNGAQCTACHETCRSCVGPESDNCLTCKDGRFLSDTSLGGICNDKTEATQEDNLQIFVQNSKNKNSQ